MYDHTHHSSQLLFSLKPLREVAWLIGINSLNQELRVSTNRRLRQLMIIHEAGSACHRTGGGREWGAVSAETAVRSGAEQLSVLCVGRDVVLLWRSAECGIAVRSDTTVGSTPTPSGSPSPGTRAPRAARSSASQSRKCGLLALSLRDKWLQRPYSSELVNMNLIIIAWL